MKERIKDMSAYILTGKYWSQYFFWKGGGCCMATMLRYDTCVCECIEDGEYTRYE